MNNLPPLHNEPPNTTKHPLGGGPAVRRPARPRRPDFYYTPFYYMYIYFYYILLLDV